MLSLLLLLILLLLLLLLLLYETGFLSECNDGCLPYLDTKACVADGLTADPNDCHAYTQCFNGRLYRLSCGPNAAFDGVTGDCVSASRVAGCEVIGSSDSTESECDICPGCTLDLPSS